MTSNPARTSHGSCGSIINTLVLSLTPGVGESIVYQADQLSTAIMWIRRLASAMSYNFTVAFGTVFHGVIA